MVCRRVKYVSHQSNRSWVLCPLQKKLKVLMVLANAKAAQCKEEDAAEKQ